MKIKKSILVETIKKVLKEADFDASKFPFPKADTTGKYAKHVAQAGKKEYDKAEPDDKVPSQRKADLEASKLSPSQQEIKLGQALGMAVSMAGKLPGPFKDGPGGDLGAVISKDGYIMDGHHRWAASIFAAGPQIKLGGFVIDMPGKDLVQVLALMGDAFHPGLRKDPSPHNIMNATADDVNNFVNKFVSEGIGEFVDAETAKRVLEEKYGSVEKAKAHFISQLKYIQKAPPEWAESRDKMPVLEPKAQEPEKVAKAMAAGDVDIYAPYAKGKPKEAPANRREAKKLKINKESLTRMVRESLKKITEIKLINEDESLVGKIVKLPRGLFPANKGKVLSFDGESYKIEVTDKRGDTSVVTVGRAAIKEGPEEEYYHITDATYDDGTLAEDIEFWDDVIEEAEYQGRKVKLNKPMRGDVKKSKVYVKDPKTGNVKKVNFGDPNMKIKKSNPERRKSFRARHNCDNPGPKTKARYWSCKAW
jgi:hypothetical protein